MGSLRNPIGPLPSSIYWRRRAVAASLVALLALLIAWVVTSGGGNGDQRAGKGKDDRGGGAASEITPGPTTSESVISERPGGRDEADDDSGGSEGSGDDGADGGSGGSGGGSDDSEGSGGSGGSGGGSAGGNGAPAVVAKLPACQAGATKLSLTSAKNEYAPGEKPKLKLTAENSGGSACKVDFGPRTSVLTVSNANDDTIWASDHCPDNGGSLLRQVPAKGDTTHTVEWNRKRSAAHCATPSAGAAKAGTYLAEVKVPGLGTAQASFVLAKD